MKYISQLNEFWNWAMINSVSQSEIALYMAILHCANISNWKPSLNLPNSTLLNLASISNASQLNKIRNKLVQKGLITYQKGSGNNCGSYTIVRLYNKSDNQTDKQMDDKRTQDGQTNGRETDNIYRQDKDKTRQDNIPPISPHRGGVPYTDILDLYNTTCARLPKALTINDSRRRAIRVMFHKHTLDDFKAVFKKANASEFLTGNNQKGWTASFDWLMKDANFVKVKEDTYANRTGNKPEVCQTKDDYDEIEKMLRERM